MVVESGASREPRKKRAKECSNLDGNGMLKGGEDNLKKCERFLKDVKMTTKLLRKGKDLALNAA